MRFGFAVLLFAVTLFAVAHAESTSAKLIASSPVSDALSDVAYKRLLRSETLVNEERAIPVSALEKLSKTQKTFMTKWSKLKVWFTTRRNIQGWLKKGDTPEDVFKLLNLDKGAETLMSNPDLNLWQKFLRAYTKKNPKKMITMIGVFTKTYGDEAVARMLEIARRNPTTYDRANSLQGRQLMGWALNGIRDPDIIFQLLKVGDTSVTKLFSNPNFIVWFYFFRRMDRFNPDWEVNMIKKLETVYGDIPLARAIEAARHVKTPENLPDDVMPIEEIANVFQNAQFKKWAQDGTKPGTIYDKLAIPKQEWLADPDAEIFERYKPLFEVYQIRKIWYF